MEISAVTSSSNPVNSIFATTPSQRVEFSIVTPVSTSSTSVDISTLGQLLSATSILNNTLGATGSTASFGTVVAVTQQLVNAFNDFLQSESQQSTSGVSIGSLFEQMLNTSGSAGTSIFSNLSAVGVNFQAATSQDVPAQMTIDFQQLQSAYTADQSGTVATLLTASQSIGQFAAQLAGAVTQADMLTQLGTLQAEATNATVSGTTATGTTVSGSTATGSTATGSTATGSTATGSTASGSTASGSTASGSTASGSTVSGSTVSGSTASGSTASGSTASANTVSGSTVSGTTASGSTASANTVSGNTVSGSTVSGSTVSGSTVSDTTASGSAVSDTTATGTTVSGTTESGATVAGTAVSSASVSGTSVLGTTGAVLSAAVTVPSTVETAAGATIDSSLASREPVAQVVSAPVSLALTGETLSLPAGSSTVLAATQAAIAQSAVANIVRTSVLINPLIDSSNPAIAAAIAAYHMVDGIFDTAWPHDGGAPPEIDYKEIRAISGMGRIKLDLTA